MEVPEIDDPESTSSSISEDIETLSQALSDSNLQTKGDLNQDTMTTIEESVDHERASLQNENYSVSKGESEEHEEINDFLHREGNSDIDEYSNVHPNELIVLGNDGTELEGLESTNNPQDENEDFFASTPPMMYMESSNRLKHVENLPNLVNSSGNEEELETHEDLNILGNGRNISEDVQSVKSLRQEEGVKFPRTPSVASVNPDMPPLNLENPVTLVESETQNNIDADEAKEGNEESPQADEGDMVARTSPSLSVLPGNENADNEVTPINLENSTYANDDKNEDQTTSPFYFYQKKRSEMDYFNMQPINALESYQTLEESNQNEKELPGDEEVEEEEVKSAEIQEEEIQAAETIEEEEVQFAEVQDDIEIQASEALQEEEEPISAEEPFMKTAGDVSKRIQSDRNLPEVYFTVGYKNQFSEVVEKPYTSFYRDQLPYVAEDNIHYFKYKGTKVWDKIEGFDHVFCSIGTDVEIEEKINEIEEYLAKRALSFTPNDEENEEDNFVLLGGGSYGSGLADSFSASSKPKATHFLCIKVKNDQVKSIAAKVKEYLLNKEPDLYKCTLPNERLHVTLARVQCSSQDAIIEVNNMLRGLRPRIQDLVGSSEFENPQRFIRAQGLSTFGDQVLYVKLDVPAAFISVTERLQESLSRIKNVIVTNHFGSMPHMTLLKVDHATARKRGFKNFDSSLYKDYVNQEFGMITFDNIHFCLIDDIRDQDGFYITSKKIEF
ncbi:uncharacterized protein LOC119592541 [Penaeus monodon]|uniref:uncharacterized protein LOC119592541 n=1 Tax=Penaeus monodon TaxID=6687 RepID=UPI0018A7B8A6|nr:uncharacterized protein LOC119592541 [Penaeus monodon]